MSIVRPLDALDAFQAKLQGGGMYLLAAILRTILFFLVFIAKRPGLKSWAVPMSVFIFVSGCTSTPVRFYQGPDRKKEDLSAYALENYANFFLGPQIYTVKVDGFDTGNRGGFISIVPGSHAVRVTFKDYENVLIPPALKENVFQGWYDITFQTKPGKAYAPIFNQNLARQDQLNEMCIAEFDGTNLSDSRVTKYYVACGTATIPPTAENIKLCTEWSGWLPRTPPKVYVEFCNAHR